MPAQKVFISRSISAESELVKLLSPHGFEVEGRSLVTFKEVHFDLPEAFDWVFFYSKQGVDFFFKALEKANIMLPKHLRFGAIGAGTAQALESKVPQIHFIGDGSPETTAQAFAKIAHGQRVLFPRAVTSRRSVQQLCGAAIIALDLVVYENTPLEEAPPSDAGFLVFTSPLNAQAYLSQHPLLPTQQLIAIGDTTTQAIAHLTDAPVFTASAPSEQAIAALVLELS